MPLLASEEAAERAGNGWRLLTSTERILPTLKLCLSKTQTQAKKGRIDFNLTKSKVFENRFEVVYINDV